MVDRAELRKLAEAATPGPWNAEHCTVWAPNPHRPDEEAAVAELCPTREDAAFIAAASPDVVLGLLDEIERLTERCHCAENVIKGFSIGSLSADDHERDQLRAVAVRLRDAIKDAERDIREVCGFLPSNDDGCDRFKHKAKALCEVLADPEVEKL